MSFAHLPGLPSGRHQLPPDARPSDRGLARHPSRTNGASRGLPSQPVLTFDGDARQALEFYRDVFGGTLTMNTFGEFGMSEPPIADQVMHGMLETDRGFALMCSDTPPGMERTVGNYITVCLNGVDADEPRGYWKQLSEGGSVSTPLERQMWGDEYGACVDRFGVHWMVNIGQPQG